MSDKFKHLVKKSVARNKNQIEEDLIYHYTTLDTFLKLLVPCGKNEETNDFFCTHIRFLNDTQEFFFGLKKALSAMEKYGVFKKEDREAIESSIVNRFEDMELSAWYMSFSRSYDSLSQWIAYTDRTLGGVAIGFDRREIERSLVALQSRYTGINAIKSGRLYVNLENCIYIQDDMDASAISDRFNKINKLKSHSPNSVTWVNRAVDEAIPLALRIKKGDFNGEEETRLMVVANKLFVREHFRYIGGKPRIKTGVFMDAARLRSTIRKVLISPHGPHDKIQNTISLVNAVFDTNIAIHSSEVSYNGE